MSQGEDPGSSRFRLETRAPSPPGCLLSANPGFPFHFPITFCPHREGRYITLWGPRSVTPGI